MSRGTRKYYQVWELLKKKEAVTLRVAPHLVARVKKAVIKEKDIDTEYKIERDLARKKQMRITSSYDMKTWHLSFTLVECSRILIEDI